MDKETQKKIEQTEYRAKLAEAELNAVKQSKAYRIVKTAGIVKKHLRSDPIGLTKKVAKIVVKEPHKLRHLVRSANRGEFLSQSVVEQNSKYQEWILLNEPDEDELNQQREESEKFKQKPLISIITPVFNPPVSVLEELIESVLEQTYPHFELCLGNFGDSNEVETLIKKYASYDSRVKHYKFTDNTGIAGNSNQILVKAEGSYIALLDHDDTISPDALYENVKAINEAPYDFLYSDKDKIDEKNNRFDPLFKPQLSPEMLLNVNYLTHFNMMKTKVIKDIGGWDPETDGAQDWDLFLRVVQVSKRVKHIPKILYHWRVIASSTAMSIDTKPYALAGQRKAINKYLAASDIPASSYHQKTELLLDWSRAPLDKSPNVFINFTSIANSHRAIRQIRRFIESPIISILVDESIYSGQSLNGLSNTNIIRHKGTFGRELKNYIDLATSKNSVFVNDDIRLSKTRDWYANLTGWLSIKDVAASCGRVVNKNDIIVSSGFLITPESICYPIFNGYPRYYQSYIGNAEWVRNLNILSSKLLAVKTALLKDISSGKNPKEYFEELFLKLAENNRLVMTPQVTGVTYSDKNYDSPYKINVNTNFVDKFNNPNLNALDPMRLFENESLAGMSDKSKEEHNVLDRYQHDAIILARSFDISSEQLKDNKGIVTSFSAIKSPSSVAWFLPSYDGVYAGLMNIFSFANYMATTKKLDTTFYILKNSDNVMSEKRMVVSAFPRLDKAKFIAITPDQVNKINAHDIGIATQWATTYPLAKTNNIKRKCYFIQDNEVNFYPKGSISSLVDMSYRFGFMAIANTQGLLSLYQDKYKGSGVVLKSLVDLKAYYPRQNRYYTPKKPYKVFFYARPNMPRNAFELGIAGLKKLKEDLGDDVEIITAGAPWNVQDYGVGGMFTNLGKIKYSAVPKLYRSVDVGLMFMFSGHPGVTASELMASGCPVVVNEYDDETWNDLYKDGETCLITLPVASEVARSLKRCLTDNNLRRRLIEGGLNKTKEFYSGYEASQDAAYQAIVGGDSN